MPSVYLSLMANDVELLFVLICRLYILSDEVSVHIFCPSCNWVICLLTVEF